MSFVTLANLNVECTYQNIERILKRGLAMSLRYDENIDDFIRQKGLAFVQEKFIKDELPPSLDIDFALHDIGLAGVSFFKDEDNKLALCLSAYEKKVRWTKRVDYYGSNFRRDNARYARILLFMIEGFEVIKLCTNWELYSEN